MQGFKSYSFRVYHYMVNTANLTLSYFNHAKFQILLILISASTSRRHLMMWKYNPSGCITALKCKHAVECLTYSKSVCLFVCLTVCFSGVLGQSDLEH